MVIIMSEQERTNELLTVIAQQLHQILAVLQPVPMTNQELEIELAKVLKTGRDEIFNK